jgi:hypothetical protein
MIYLSILWVASLAASSWYCYLWGREEGHKEGHDNAAAQWRILVEFWKRETHNAETDLLTAEARLRRLGADTHDLFGLSDDDLGPDKGDA